MMIISTKHRNRPDIQTRLETKQIKYDQHLTRALHIAITDFSLSDCLFLFRIRTAFLIIPSFWHSLIFRFLNSAFSVLSRMLFFDVWIFWNSFSIKIEQQYNHCSHYWRYTNADLKIFLCFCANIKSMPWKFHIPNPKNSRVICPWSL